MTYDVVIVGVNSAGLFCAYELITKNSDLKIVMLIKGLQLKKEFGQ